ncbi:hypothetical protein BH09MYX1_BH09MYX1_51450 [soil metagenome]
MARPREAQKSRELAERAVAVLEREGLGSSTEQLARAIDVKRPTLLYHFPTYTHAIEVVLTTLLAEQAAFVERKVEKQTHPIDRLYARLRAIHEFHRGREARILFLSQAVAVAGGPRAVEIVKHASEFFELDRRAMVERVESGLADGIVHPCDAHALIALLRATIDGLTIQRVTSREPLEPVYEMIWKRILLPLKKKKRKS